MQVIQTGADITEIFQGDFKREPFVFPFTKLVAQVRTVNMLHHNEGIIPPIDQIPYLNDIVMAEFAG